MAKGDIRSRNKENCRSLNVLSMVVCVDVWSAMTKGLSPTFILLNPTETCPALLNCRVICATSTRASLSSAESVHIRTAPAASRFVHIHFQFTLSVLLST